MPQQNHSVLSALSSKCYALRNSAVGFKYSIEMFWEIFSNFILNDRIIKKKIERAESNAYTIVTRTLKWFINVEFSGIWLELMREIKHCTINVLLDICIRFGLLYIGVTANKSAVENCMKTFLALAISSLFISCTICEKIITVIASKWTENSKYHRKCWLACRACAPNMRINSWKNFWNALFGI